MEEEKKLESEWASLGKVKDLYQACENTSNVFFYMPPSNSESKAFNATLGYKFARTNFDLTPKKIVDYRKLKVKRFGKSKWVKIPVTVPGWLANAQDLKIIKSLERPKSNRPYKKEKYPGSKYEKIYIYTNV